VLDRIAALTNLSPNGNFIIIWGIENNIGRDITFPKVLVKAVFVVGSAAASSAGAAAGGGSAAASSSAAAG
jgi:hypothetical protein